LNGTDVRQTYHLGSGGPNLDIDAPKDSKGNLSGKPNRAGFGVVLHMVAKAKMLRMVAKYEVVMRPKSKLLQPYFWGRQMGCEGAPRGPDLIVR
jgi:hypothetical protein